jgi:hypothetical protein
MGMKSSCTKKKIDINVHGYYCSMSPLKKTVFAFMLTFELLCVFVAGNSCLGVSPQMITPTSEQTAHLLDYERLFDVDVVYAYAQPGVNFAAVLLNVTQISNQTLLSTAGITEVYTTEVISNGIAIPTKGALGRTIGQVPSADDLMTLTWGLGQFYTTDSRVPGLMSLEASYNIRNYSLVEPVSINVIWLGWVLFDGDLGDPNLARHEIVQTVVLDRYNDGFLYNTLFPFENLSQINLLSPPKSFSHPLVTSTIPSISLPSQEAISQSEFILWLTPTLIVVLIVVLVALAGTAVLIYLNRRRYSVLNNKSSTEI